jgi:hypothetical protein
MMRPVSLGAPTIRIRPVRIHRDGVDLFSRTITVEI